MKIRPHVIYRSRKKLYKAIQGLFESLCSKEKYQKVPKLPQWVRPTGFQKANAFFIEKLFRKICLHLLALKQLSWLVHSSTYAEGIAA